MVNTHIKGDIFVLIKTFSIIFQVSVDKFLSFFHVFEIINLSVKCVKNIRGLPCLFRRYCAKYRQNGHFLSFSEGSFGEFYKSWLKSNKFQSFR